MSSENNNQSVQDLLNIDLDAIVEEGQQKAAKKRKKTAVTTAIVAAICLVFALVYIVINVVIPLGQYKDATKLLEQKVFQEAIDGFEALGDYKNSADMVSETKYQWAESLLAEKSYDEAYAKFKEIQDYSDAADRMKDVRYAEAMECLESNGYWKAIGLFEKLGDYKDSRTRALEANYLWAEDYLKQGQLEGALMYFEKAGDYKDAKARADEVYEMMQIHATAVKLSKTSLTIDKGKTAELTATLEPSDTTDTIVSWTSSDEKVATVDGNGVVKAVGYGTATIEVKTSNDLKSVCKVTIPNETSQNTEKTPNSSGKSNSKSDSICISNYNPNWTAAEKAKVSPQFHGTWSMSYYSEDGINGVSPYTWVIDLNEGIYERLNPNGTIDSWGYLITTSDPKELTGNGATLGRLISDNTIFERGIHKASRWTGSEWVDTWTEWTFKKINSVTPVSGKYQ